jgi:photosystem II stability/assembly factor-like uncharacterized protein
MPFAEGITPMATVSGFLVDRETIWAVTDQHGVYRIRAGNPQWEKIDRNLPPDVDINTIVNNGDRLVIGTYRHGIFLSDDGGVSWTSVSNDLGGNPVRSLIDIDGILLAGTDHGIYRSTDRGEQWIHAYGNVQVNGLTVHDEHVYAAVMNGAMISRDLGMNWQYIYQPLALHDIHHDGRRLYAMTLGGGLMASANEGMTWEHINDGMGTTSLYTFEVRAYDSRIFAAQWHGIYVSTGPLVPWTLLQNGLPDSTAFITLETTSDGLIAGLGGQNKQKFKE